LVIGRLVEAALEEPVSSFKQEETAAQSMAIRPVQSKKLVNQISQNIRRTWI